MLDGEIVYLRTKNAELLKENQLLKAEIEQILKAEAVEDDDVIFPIPPKKRQKIEETETIQLPHQQHQQQPQQYSK